MESTTIFISTHCLFFQEEDIKGTAFTSRLTKNYMQLVSGGNANCNATHADIQEVLRLVYQRKYRRAYLFAALKFFSHWYAVKKEMDKAAWIMCEANAINLAAENAEQISGTSPRYS